MKSSKVKISAEGQSDENDQMHIQSRRFQEACEAICKNSAKFLENALSSESSSEDEIDDLQIMKNLFKLFWFVNIEYLIIVLLVFSW
ncbi:hypothetical protein TNCV_3742321 [Trichonephila clavipes]|nr:hypothetical protein TNCV_3742321 [Trichonephila clavipes]